jgi:hypothetical protein
VSKEHIFKPLFELRLREGDFTVRSQLYDRRTTLNQSGQTLQIFDLREDSQFSQRRWLVCNGQSLDQLSSMASASCFKICPQSVFAGLVE